MELVEDDHLEVAEEMSGMGIGDYQGKLLGCGDQYVGRRRALAAALVGGSIAGAGLYGDAKAHFADRHLKITGNVYGKCLERGNVKSMDAAPQRTCGEVDEARQKAGKRLAAPGWSDQQHAVARPCL